MKPGRSLVAGFLGLLALGGLVVVMFAFQREASFAANSVIAQRVRPSSEAALFGDIGENIGSPTEYVVDDPQMLLDHQGPNGISLIDESYLEKTGRYPLQLKTVRYTAMLAKIGGGFATLVCGAVLFFLLRTKPPASDGTIAE
ncbi:MAG: hypothetical protein AB7F50_02430 [Fimbriimonadaceae bacterium]